MQHEMQHKKIKALKSKAFRTEKEGFEPSRRANDLYP